MTCPRCGSEVSVVSARCRVCSAPLGRRVAASVLTPPPEANEQLTVMPVPADADDGTKVIATPLSAGAADNEGATYMPGVRGNRDDRHTSAPQKPPVQPDDLAPVRPEDAATTFEEAKARPRGDTGPLTIGQAFGNRYHIIKLLGIGGMGAVYQAWDDELAVAVAIKVIRPDVMADPHAAAEIERRFKRELLLARQVTHKNVVRIHDLGEIGGIKYITMPYVDGADLATVHRRDGRLPVSRVLHIARSVVGGLVEAHKAGVVHRDLKPANIMIGPDDDAMIMDFGIARSTGSPTAGAVPGPDTIVRNLRSPATHLDATVYGAVVGTVAYMAPEQAKGLTVDQRADIYAFGLILYDLLVGESRSTKAENALAELHARMKHAPPPVKTLVPEVSADVDRIITRCLEPDPDKRFQTSEELAAALALLDYEGVPIPIPPRFSKKLIAGAATVMISLVTATWYFTRVPPPVKPHDPVTVLIADFQNNTNDPEFDHTLEPMLRRALESAGFISAYDRSRIRVTFGVRPPDRLDELAARELALKQGVGMVVSGAIDRRNNGYQVSVKAAETVTGKVVDMATSRLASKDEVVANATKLVTTIRKALGDETSDSAQLLAMRSLSTTSMAVAGHYAAAIEAQSDGKMEEARASYQKTVELDPNFGLGYQGLAIMSRNLGKLEDANKYTTEALKHIEGMTDRERFAVRASYYMTTGDFQQCVKEYGELIAQFAADAVGHNNRALCLSKLRNMREAADELRQSIQILPKRATLRANLAMLGNYAGDFETAERETKALQEPTDYSTLAVAFAHLGQGRVPEATETYNKLATMTTRGASWAASGLGDLAVYEGRFSDAIRTFEQSAASDLGAKNTDRAARKLTSLANVYLLTGQKNQAIAAADRALTYSKAVPVRFLAARVFVEAGAVAKARPIADGLSAELPAEPHGYGKIIEGEIALKSGDPRQATRIWIDAGAALDTWLHHFDLGRAYLELKAFPQADSEFDRCIKRRGEALALLIDEEPTYGYFPPVYYYQGLVREGLGNAKSSDSYREYLKIRGKSTEDPLLPEIRKKVAN
jgi:eukaryotic-like serine/threonine-protein kinase